MDLKRHYRRYPIEKDPGTTVGDKEPHRTGRIGWLRATVLKVNRRANEMASVEEADAFSAAPLCTEVLQ